MPITIDVNIRFHDDESQKRFDRVDSVLRELLNRSFKMSNDLSALQATVAALGDKVTESNATLAGLAQAVVDLKNAQPADVQAGIDALTAQAQGILDSLSAAEDAADDQLPA